MKKLMIMLMMLVVVAFSASAKPKVIRESKWNDEDCIYILMYDEDSTYGGRYYVYRYLSFYEENQYDKMIGQDILEYWLAREANCVSFDVWDFTEESTIFSLEENKFIIYERVTKIK